MLAILEFLLFLYLHQCFAISVYQYLEKHKNILNSSIHILKNSENKTFLQYDFYIAHNVSVIKETMDNLNGIILNVGFSPNSDANFDCSFENNKLVSGYSLDVLKNLQEILKFEVEFSKPDSTAADIILCHNLSSTLAFPLYTTLTSQYSLIFKYNKLGNTKDIFRLTFVGTLWVIFLVILIFLAICLKISTKQQSIIWRKDHPWNWVEITLWAIATVCQQGLSYTPRGFCSQAIFLLGYITAYLLYTGFAAGITSILVGKDILKQINIQELQTENVQLFSIGYLKEDWPQNLANYVGKNYVESVAKLFDILNNKNAVGIAPNLLLQEYMIKNFDYEQVSWYHVTKSELIYKRNFWVTNNTFAKFLNRSIIKMKQTGLLQRLLKKHKPVIPKSDYLSDYSSVGREHIQSALLLFLGGVVASVMFLLIEITYTFYKNCRKGVIKLSV